MRNASGAEKLQIVQGRPWKDALITVLEPRSPYRPWHRPRDVSPGDAVVHVVNTEPPSVLASIGTVRLDSDSEHFVTSTNHTRHDGLLELERLNTLANCEITSDEKTVYDTRAREAIVKVIGEHSSWSDDASFGHTSLAAARVLLASKGVCTGCELRIDLTGEDARNAIHIHSVAETPVPLCAEPKRRGDESGGLDTDATPTNKPYSADSIKVRAPDYRRSFPDDWPAILCDSCHDQYRCGSASGFINFKFGMHPRCPSCSGQRSMSTMYGMLVRPITKPWIVAMGCCVEPWSWICGQCGHKW